MKGDFTWLRFDRQKHYRGVLMQQGRVQMDSDWNEQVLLAEYRYSTFLGDFIGHNGAPAEHGMHLIFDPTARLLRLSAGRHYVDGLMAENEAELRFSLPTTTGMSLAYLDVWSGHVTAADDADLREPALGGPETATRIRTQWMLRFHALGTPSAAALDEIRKKYRGTWPVLPTPDAADCWQMPLGSGRMTVATGQVALTDSRLYRVEVHSSSTNDAGVAQKPRFKWSRDNASVLAPLASIDATSKTLTLQDTGLAVQNAFSGVEWVEISDALCAASGAPGYLVAVDASLLRDGKLLLQESWQYARTPEQLQPPILVRRWDGSETTASFTLDGGLKVGFDGSPYQYRSGDYWLIPVRQNMVLDWADKVPQAPHGTEHRYAALALVDSAGNVESLASVFQPLTTGHVSKKGDTIDGDLAVLGRLSVGSNVFRGPLTLAAAANGLLASFGSRGGAEAWRISQSNGAAPSLNITDAIGKGLTIASGGNVGIGIGTATPSARLDVTGGNIVWGSGSALQSNQGGSIELWGDPALDDPGPKLGRPYIDFHCNGRTTANQTKDFDARIINDAIGRLSVSAPTVYLDGKLGIGEKLPTAKLHVAGGAQISGNTAIGGTAPGNYRFMVSGGDTRIAAPDEKQALFGLDRLVGKDHLRFYVDDDLSKEVMHLDDEGLRLLTPNPNKYKGFKNTLTPKNIAKAWALVKTGDGVSQTIVDGFNVKSVETKMESGWTSPQTTIYLAEPITEDMCIVGNMNGTRPSMLSFQTLGGSKVKVYAYYLEVIGAPLPVVSCKSYDFTKDDGWFSFVVYGAQ